jgi:hypothetical protein
MEIAITWFETGALTGAHLTVYTTCSANDGGLGGIETGGMNSICTAVSRQVRSVEICKDRNFWISPGPALGPFGPTQP